MSGRGRRARGALLALFPIALAAPASAGAGFSCPDLTPAAIQGAAAGGLDCQKAIAKEGAKFLAAKTKALSKCLLKEAPGTCPTADDVAKVEEAAQKAQTAISKKCADDAAQAGLVSSYGALTDDTVIGSCMLSQHNASADVLVANATGVFSGDFPAPEALDDKTAKKFGKARSKCASEANKTGIGYGLDVLGEIAKCLDVQMKQGVAGDLAPVCIGAWAGGVYTPPTDAKTAEKLAKLQTKAQDKLAKKCGDPDALGFLPSVFACGGANSVAELQECLLCEGFSHAVDLAEHQYGEAGTLVENGAANAIETAVNAAAPGAKLLIEPGDYPEQVTIETNGIQLVGCGGATNDRPRLVRPEGAGPFPRGIQATGIDGLLFQSLEVVNWDDDGIFVADAQGVTFRDVLGDGGEDNSTYAIFPVQSDGVVVEGCISRRIVDAAVYVGQSTNILVRFNKVQESVAGIEIENSANATVHNNYAQGNTGGILVFKAEGLGVQLSNDHVVSHNVLDANNRVNIGSGTVGGIPDGTGMLIISNDDSVFEYNVIRGNNQFGIALTDQAFAIGPPLSPDQDTERNLITRNVATGNALAPDGVNPASDIVFAISPSTTHGNCIEDNVDDLDPILLTPSQCP